MVLLCPGCPALASLPCPMLPFLVCPGCHALAALPSDPASHRSQTASCPFSLSALNAPHNRVKTMITDLMLSCVVYHVVAVV